MTITIVWRRKFSGVDEIIFASDSRLSAGYRWDCAQKIFPIDGPNFCISFAGSADFAFPCIFQFQCMVKNYPKFSTGAAPISLMVKDFITIVNQLLGLVDDRILAQFNSTTFLVAGYDFSNGEMYGKEIKYNKTSRKYEKFDFGGFRSGAAKAAIGFAGEGYQDFFSGLGKLVAKRKTELNYEPLEVLAEIIYKQGKGSTIGGSPQLVKVYRHRNYLPYAVKKNKEEGAALFGRPLLDYEKTIYPIISINDIPSGQYVTYPMSKNNKVRSQPGSLVRNKKK